MTNGSVFSQLTIEMPTVWALSLEEKLIRAERAGFEARMQQEKVS